VEGGVKVSRKAAEAIIFEYLRCPSYRIEAKSRHDQMVFVVSPNPAFAFKASPVDSIPDMQLFVFSKEKEAVEKYLSILAKDITDLLFPMPEKKSK
jgi:hypothetical protein